MIEQDLSPATQAARALLAVRRGAPRLAALPAALAPHSLADAYAIQHALLKEMRTDTAGWKASLFGAEDGACAPLPANAVVDAPAYTQVLHTPLRSPAPYAIEAEIAFRLGQDLPPLPRGARYGRDAVCAAVASAHAVIEVVASRYVNADAVSHLERVADQLINALLVVGPSCQGWQALPLRQLPLEVRVEGHPVYQGRGAHPQGDPLAPLVWLANHLSQYGRGLRAGELVTTGSCCGVLQVAPEQTASAHFAGLGSAVVTF
jgi:2-keto-4-pentenoate hydratase